MTCNGDCNQGRECICDCEGWEQPTNMVTVPLNKLEDMQRRLKATQEPVLYIDQDGLDGHATWAQATRCQDSDIALYTHPPKEWQSLSDDEVHNIWFALEHEVETYISYGAKLAHAIEAKLREKNT